MEPQESNLENGTKLPSHQKRTIRRDPLAPYRRCTCGTCPRCLDNEKWDRIFRKFEVAEYDIKGVFGSPLRDI